MSGRRGKRPCGIYRTTEPIGDHIPAGVLVFYHNHGDPGPGVYLPRTWTHNRAIFAEQGTTAPGGYEETLEPLPDEGLYRVVEPFYCCQRRCQHFEQDLLVQLGYNGDAEALLFVPELVDNALVFPERGTFVDPHTLSRLQPLKVPERTSERDPDQLN